MSWQKKIKDYITIKLTRLLKGFFPAKYSLDTQNPRILIVCTAALGDNIWSSPVLAAIKQHYPTAYLAYLTSPLGHAIMQHDPHIDEFFILPKDRLGYAISLWKTLRKKHFQFVYSLQISQRNIAPMINLLGAQRTACIARNSKNLEATFDYAVENPTDRHIVITRLTGLNHIHIPIPPNPRLTLYWQNEDELIAQQFLAQHFAQPDKPTILIQVGASKPSRFWQTDKFTALGKWLTDQYDCNIIICGGPKEEDRVLTVQAGIPNAATLFGQLPLTAYAALVKRACLMVTTDTGPIHMAAATNVPIVAIYGNSNEKLYGAFKAKLIQYVKLPKAVRQQLDPNDRAIQQVPLEQVKQACKDILSQLDIH